MKKIIIFASLFLATTCFGQDTNPLAPPPINIQDSIDMFHTPTNTPANIPKEMLEDCKNLQQDITVDVDFPEIEYNFNYNLADLWNIEGHDIAGYTMLKPYVQRNNQYEKATSEDNTIVCMKPSLHYTIGYKQILVLIAKEFSEDDCQKKYVLTHELGHVKIAYDFINDAQKQYLEYLQKNYQDKIFLGSNEQIENQIKNIQNLDKDIDDNYNILEEKEKAFDSPEELAKNKTACGGEFIKRVQELDVQKEDGQIKSTAPVENQQPAQSPTITIQENE